MMLDIWRRSAFHTPRPADNRVLTDGLVPPGHLPRTREDRAFSRPEESSC
ncbi:hypothetical protein ACFQV4_21305 [Streptomyces thermocarboxydus]